MIARAKTSRPQKSVKAKKKAAKVAKPAKAAVRSKAKPAKVAVRSKAKPTQSVKLVRKKVVRPRAKKTVAPVKAVGRKPVRGKPVGKKAVGKKPVGGKSVVAKPVVKPVAAKPVAAKPVIQQVVQVVAQALDDMKAVDVTVLDVRNRTDITDTLIVASGTSDRHVRSIAQRVVENAKKAGFRPMGVEGEREGEWILVDLHDLILHIMLPRVREFYRLENLWDVSVAHREAAVTAS